MTNLLPCKILFGVSSVDKEYRQQTLLMEARSEHVKTGLRSAYASQVPGENLDVFCVSNKMYEKYTKRGNAELVTASRIPELRRFCYGITADAQFREGSHFLRSLLSSLFSSLELWLDHGQSSLKEEESELDESFYEIFDDVKKEVCVHNL